MLSKVCYGLLAKGFSKSGGKIVLKERSEILKKISFLFLYK
jgi:hypothetical protein